MDPRFGEMLDTSPEARATYYELLARLSPEARRWADQLGVSDLLSRASDQGTA